MWARKCDLPSPFHICAPCPCQGRPPRRPQGRVCRPAPAPSRLPWRLSGLLFCHAVALHFPSLAGREPAPSCLPWPWVSRGKLNFPQPPALPLPSARVLYTVEHTRPWPWDRKISPAPWQNFPFPRLSGVHPVHAGARDRKISRPACRNFPFRPSLPWPASSGSAPWRFRLSHHGTPFCTVKHTARKAPASRTPPKGLHPMPTLARAPALVPALLGAQKSVRHAWACPSGSLPPALFGRGRACALACPAPLQSIQIWIDCLSRPALPVPAPPFLSSAPLPCRLRADGEQGYDNAASPARRNQRRLAPVALRPTASG